MRIEDTVLHVWGMRTLCQAAATGALLDVFANLAESIEGQTEEVLEARGLGWAENGLRIAPGAKGLDGTVGLDVTREELGALVQAYYGSPECRPMIWPQELPAAFRRAARTLGPALMEWRDEANAEAQFEAMPEGMRKKVAYLCRVENAPPLPPVNGGESEEPC